MKIEIILRFGFGFDFMTLINTTEICWFNDENVSLEFNVIND